MFDDEVLGILREQLERAERLHADAKRDFWDAAHKIADLQKPPTQQPTLNGLETLRRIAARENLMINAYIEAVTRMNNYLMHRIVPDDVEEKLAKCRTAGGASH